MSPRTRGLTNACRSGSVAARSEDPRGQPGQTHAAFLALRRFLRLAGFLAAAFLLRRPPRFLATFGAFFAAGFRADFVRVFFAAIFCTSLRVGMRLGGSRSEGMLHDVYCHLL